MSNFLNIDELLGEPRSIKWQGKDYPVTELTLGVALMAQKMIEEGRENNIEDAKKIFDVCVPGLDIDSLPARAIMPLMVFVTTPVNSKNAEEPPKTKNRKK